MKGRDVGYSVHLPWAVTNMSHCAYKGRTVGKRSDISTIPVFEMRLGFLWGLGMIVFVASMSSYTAEAKMRDNIERQASPFLKIHRLFAPSN